MGCPRGHALTSIYASQLFDVIESQLPDAQAYADDPQLYTSFNPNITDAETPSLLSSIVLMTLDHR